MLHYYFLFMFPSPSGGSGELILIYLGIPGPGTACDTQWALDKSLEREGKVFSPVCPCAVGLSEDQTPLSKPRLT